MLNKGDIYLEQPNLFTSITISEQLDQEYCGSLVLFDENIFTSSYENQKRSIALEINKNCCGHWSQ